MQIIKEGSVRIDLLGGTLDLWPINLVIPQVVTLNMAINLRARVVLEKSDGGNDEIVIESLDYGKTYTGPEIEQSQEMSLIAELLRGLEITSGIKLSLQSGSPPGAGLGGSSAMAITVVSALNEFLQLQWPAEKTLRYAHAAEAKILNAGPAGHQDYYPALYGGILALRATCGEVEVGQLFSPSLKDFLEQHCTLVYSGENRQSGVNNWQVYKRFFDGDKDIRKGLEQIAEFSAQANQAIQHGHFPQLLDLMAQEGAARTGLFPGIATPEVSKLVESLNSQGLIIGHKICGAGGGGCFVLLHNPDAKEGIATQVVRAQMTVLDYEIDPPKP